MVPDCQRKLQQARQRETQAMEKEEHSERFGLELDHSK